MIVNNVTAITVSVGTTNATAAGAQVYGVSGRQAALPVVVDAWSLAAASHRPPPGPPPDGLRCTF